MAYYPVPDDADPDRRFTFRQIAFDALVPMIGDLPSDAWVAAVEIDRDRKRLLLRVHSPQLPPVAKVGEILEHINGESEVPGE